MPLPTSKPFFIALLLCLFFAVGVRAEVSPARLMLLRGVIALGDRRSAQAVTDLHEAATINPEDWHCQVLYGQALLQAKELEQARAQFRRATLLAPTDPATWLAQEEAARMMNDPHLEIAAIAGMLRLLPDDPLQLLRLAQLYRATDRATDAEKIEARCQDTLPPLKMNYIYRNGFHIASLTELRELTKQEPANRAIIFALATEEIRAEHYPEACDCLRRLYAGTPDNPEIVGAYAHLLLRTGRIDEGLRVLASAGDKAGYAGDRTLALWNLSARHYREAIAPLQRVLMRNMIDGPLNRMMGLAQFFTGDLKASCAAYRIAWLRDHDHLTAQQYAVALQADGQASEAEDVLQRAMERAPEESALGLQLSLLYRDTNRLPACAQLTEKLAASRPESVELLILAGERYYRAGNIQQAYTVAGTLRDRFPADQAAMRGAVDLFNRLAARDEARMTLTRYLGPNLPSPISTDDLLLLVAQYAVDDNRLADAEAALEAALKRMPDCREAYLQLGRLYQQQSNWGEAVQAYQRALVRWPGDEEFTLALARVAWQAGNFPRAMSLYRAIAGKMDAADPLLELGTLYYRQGDDSRARECWHAAAARPDGQIRARLNLLHLTEQNADAGQIAAEKADLLDTLTKQRVDRATRWQASLTAANLTATPEELDALLLMEPDLVDPGVLQGEGNEK